MANQTGPVFTQLQVQLGAQPIAGNLLTVCDETVDQSLSKRSRRHLAVESCVKFEIPRLFRCFIKYRVTLTLVAQRDFE
jgi:hypothetical protein